MSGPFGSSQWMYQSAKGFYDYEIGQSLRFEDGDNAYLHRTPTSAGNQKTWTMSVWIKRGNIGTQQNIFNPHLGGDAHNEAQFHIRADNTIRFYDSGGLRCNAGTSAVFRDVGAWYHIVFRVDTTQATASNRLRLYVNGEQVALVNQGYGPTYPSQNVALGWNGTSKHSIGSYRAGTSSAFDGYMAEFNHVDGQSLAPTSFGETKSGIWIPKEYTGSYGTNGFHLDFGDISPASDLGKDVSGNGNNYTPVAFFGSDQVLDSPTNNFPVMMSNNDFGGFTISQGNTKVVTNHPGNDKGVACSFNLPTSGKWYWENRISISDNSDARNTQMITHKDAHLTAVGTEHAQVNCHSTSIYVVGATKNSDLNTAIRTGGGGILTFAYDADNDQLWMKKDAAPDTSTTANVTGLSNDGNLKYIINEGSGSVTGTNVVNFGQDVSFAGAISVSGNADGNGQGEFRYSPPSGFLALCSANLPDLAIDPNADETPEDYFNTVLDTGTGSAKSVTGVGFKPDWVWRKARSNAQNHTLYDAVRGATKILQSNTSAAEDTNANSLTSFDSDGFSLGTAYPNDNNYTYASWCWLAGNGTSSNTDGSVTTTTSVNAKAGFSILTYTEPTGSSSYGHGLDERPELIIIKRRNGAEGWITWHEQFAPPTNKALYLNENYAQGASGSNWMTAVSDSTFTYTSGQYTSAGTKVAYCFHSVEGYSKIGKYEGNGSSDGAFIYTGFRPAFIIMKRYDAAANWIMVDNKRIGYNVDNYDLSPDQTIAEEDNNRLDILSNGFKFRSSYGTGNTSGGDYIYIAFAEQPFKYANAR